MKFLKTLQRNQIEQPLDKDALDNIVPPEKVKREESYKPPELYNILDSIKKTSNSAPKNLAINNQPDSLTSVLQTIEIPPVAEEHAKFEPESADSFASRTVDPEYINPRLVAITQPNSAYCEEYRGLRTQILHTSEKQKLQSIVVVSVGPSEGKSVTALNLSWLLAQSDGSRTLLMDCDLRNPRLADYFGMEIKTGLLDILEGESSLAEAVIRLEPAGLYLLPGGESERDVAELISGLKFKTILNEISEMFDYVIIDSPPLGVFTDAAVLINQADSALLVVCANKTRYKDVERVLEMLPREKMLGAVLNQSEDTLISENSYYYDYYNKRSDKKLRVKDE